MSCSSCTPVKPIASCLTTMIIGDGGGAYANALIYVYIRNVTTGKNIRLSSQCTAAGIIQPNVSSISFLPNQSYEIWVTTQAAASVTDYLPFKIDGDPVDTYSCIALRFFSVSGPNNLTAQFATQTISLVV